MLEEFVKSQFRDFVRSGGKPVDKDQAEARIQICKGCPMFGKVQPKEGLIMDGCTVCGCPSATKPYYETYFRIKGKERENLTLDELVQIKLGNKKNTIEIKSECPHVDGNKWAEVDKEFLNK